jgi:hypothetical protein
MPPISRICRGIISQNLNSRCATLHTEKITFATQFDLNGDSVVGSSQRCRADCSAIFADFELTFALAMAALAAVQSAEERERILASCARPASLCQREVDAAFEVCD